MAAECARNALLEKVVDNKADSGIVSPTFLVGFFFQGFIIVSVAFCYIVIIITMLAGQRLQALSCHVI